MDRVLIMLDKYEKYSRYADCWSKANYHFWQACIAFLFHDHRNSDCLFFESRQSRRGMMKIPAFREEESVHKNQVVLFVSPVFGSPDRTGADLWSVKNLPWKKFLTLLATGLLVTGLAGCSSSTHASQGPYPGHSATWFARGKNADSLHTQMVWCAKNNPQMTVASCAAAKKGYTMIGGHWNQSVIDMLK